MNNSILENMKNKNQNLSLFACPDNKAERFKDIKDDFRTPFYRDTDKVLYTLSYIRYLDKTQVFSGRDNDHLTKRIIHVQFVSKIARTIGRALNLNEDLIEAAALGHDLGHTPFGHEGEKILNKLSLEHNEGYFKHNLQSVRLLMNVENYGKGINATFQVLDAIMCHNGEELLKKYEPRIKTKEEFLKEYNLSYKEKIDLIPATLEGCVVRISDFIAYIGRDIEDGIRMNLIKKDDIPTNITEILGLKNNEIVDTIIKDIINNSINQNYIKISDDVFNALKELMKFNYEKIYQKSNTLKEKDIMEEKITKVFNHYLKDLNNKNKKSNIYQSFLHQMSEEYLKNSNARIVIDYISGMTDDFLEKEYENINMN